MVSIPRNGETSRILNPRVTLESYASEVPSTDVHMNSTPISPQIELLRLVHITDQQPPILAHCQSRPFPSLSLPGQVSHGERSFSRADFQKHEQVLVVQFEPARDK